MRIRLANKVQVYFSAAVVLILGAALLVPMIRMKRLVDEGQREIARRLAEAWLDDLIQLGGSLTPLRPRPGAPLERPLRLSHIDADELELYAVADPFLADAAETFETWANQIDTFKADKDAEGRQIYRYARAIRLSDLQPARGGFSSDLPPTQVANPLRGILLIEMRAEWADRQLMMNGVYLAIAGLLAGLLAIGVLWFITMRIILSPMRVLRESAEKVAEGDLNVRCDINSGDEFEQLSETFNTMVTNLKKSQDQLRDLNKQLDLKLGELAEVNVSLYEANRLKGDFLANVSHELRTPLNSIIGFADVLVEGFAAAAPQDPTAEKRLRYARNILESSRSLLTMISELLDLAKIEANRIDLHVDAMSVRETCEALLNLMRPQADPKAIELELNVRRDVPMVRTDPARFQQIIFNFLSNAVKFTPEGGKVVLGAEPLSDGEGVRVWVTDTGPGIDPKHHETIFEKFHQLDSSHTKPHGGTGLGLAISRELAKLLRGRIELDSDVGRGATFSLFIPLTLDEKPQPLMPV